MSRFLALFFLGIFLPGGLSLKCYQCSGVPYNCLETEQTCYINQTNCMSQGHTIVDGEDIVEWTFKGCSQGLVCNETAFLDRGSKKTYITSQCCTSDLCNAGTYYSRIPVASLYCLTCEGDPASCALQNLTSLQCAGVQERCMTITTANTTDSRTDTVIKGCGTGNLCDLRLEYNNGKETLYTGVSCCGKDNCNNGTTTVTVNEDPNGLQCYACKDMGDCLVNNASKIQCTGGMNRCMDVVAFPSDKTMMRGCCSENMCLGLSASLAVLPSHKRHCCSGNLCNNGVLASYYRSSARSTRGSAYTLGTALLLLLLLPLTDGLTALL